MDFCLKVVIFFAVVLVASGGFNNVIVAATNCNTSQAIVFFSFGGLF